MRKSLFLCLIIVSSLLLAGEIPLGTSPLGSPAITDNSLAISYNPAALGFRSILEFQYGFPFDNNREFTGEYGIFLKLGSSAFSMESIRDSVKFMRYQYGLGLPLPGGFYTGFTYRWSNDKTLAREWDLGVLYRPHRMFSWGLQFRNLTEANENPWEIYTGVAIRPFSDRVTIGSDFYTLNREKWHWRFNGSLELPRGLVLSAQYSPDDQLLGLSLNLFIPNASCQVTQYSSSGSSQGGSFYFSAFTANYPTFFSMAPPRVVEVDLNFPLTEEPGIPFLQRNPTLYQLVVDLRRYSSDKTIKGLVLKLGPLFSAGLAQLEELRKALERFQSSGKEILCYAEVYNNGTYYLASVCDEVYLNPSGELWLTGLSSVQLFFKGLMDKLGIEAQFERIGAFKSAVEPFTNEQMSDSNRVMINALLDDINSHFVAGIASGRDKTAEEVQELIDNGPYYASKALELGLVDSLYYQDQFDSRVKRVFGEKTRVVKWNKIKKLPSYRIAWSKKGTARIALIYAVGTITPGKSQRNPFTGVTSAMGSETISRAIRKAREDKGIKAIVLRIDSPGGSALASDVILREIELTTSGSERKPLIVSMGNVAASGGYWIASLADTIVADPMTITGSIGVLGGKINFKKTLEKSGLNVQAISRGKNSLILSPFQPFSAEERAKIRSEIEWIYDRFLENVSWGRGLSKDEVNRIGRGRVWTGNQGKTLGLVDLLGDLNEAILVARAAAGIPEKKKVEVEIYPGVMALFFQLKSGTDVQLPLMGKLMTSSLTLKSILHYWLNTNEYFHTIMPFYLEIK